MRTFVLLSGFVLFLASCQEEIGGFPDGFCERTDLKGSKDMAAASLCPAARGLTSDNLLCENFANPQTTIASLTTKGWNFSAAALNCPGWDIMGGLLEVMNFTNFGNGTCGLTPSMITAAQIQKYSRLTISIQQRIDLSDPEQQAQLYLDADKPNTRLMWTATGKKDVPRQQTTITIDTADLPAVFKSNGFKWLFELTSQAMISSRKGWQFESIAVNGNL